MRSARLVIGMIVLLGACTAVFAQSATLEASVDRETIRANESFTYVLRVQGQLPGRPDLSALASDFDVLDTWSSTSIQIVNGRTAQVAEYGVELMPRGPGHFEIPPAELGGFLSNRVEVDILPEPTVSGQADDIYIEVELDRPVAYVQSQVIYTLRLFVGIGTGRATLTAPLVEGGEAIVEKLGSDREYQSVRGNRAYNVRERSYAIFPQTAGELTIGPAVFDAMVIPNRGFTRQQRLRSEVLELEVRPAVAPPASHPNAVWLPARDLRIEQSWSDRGEIFEQGVPRTRELTIVADGLLETQLPEIELPTADGFRQYGDQPELSRDVTADGIRASRTERFAVIAQQPGTATLPGVELPWFDVETGRWEVARLDPVTFDVLPGQSVAPTDTAVEPPPRPTVVEGDPGLWPWLSAFLGLGWLATAAAWLIVGGRTRRPHRPAAAPPERTSARTLMKQLDAACRVGDAARVQGLLLEWGRLQFSEQPPTSLGALAERLTGPLGEEIAALEAALYGPRQSAGWQGQRLAELLRQTRSVARTKGGKDTDPLVPLYR